MGSSSWQKEGLARSAKERLERCWMQRGCPYLVARGICTASRRSRHAAGPMAHDCMLRAWTHPRKHRTKQGSMGRSVCSLGREQEVGLSGERGEHGKDRSTQTLACHESHSSWVHIAATGFVRVKRDFHARARMTKKCHELLCEHCGRTWIERALAESAARSSASTHGSSSMPLLVTAVLKCTRH